MATELAINAVKHGAGDGQPATLTLEAYGDGIRELKIDLDDNGPGQPVDFDMAATKGMGMTIVMSTIGRLGGTIRAVPGEGAAFEIVLPLA